MNHQTRDQAAQQARRDRNQSRGRRPWRPYARIGEKYLLNDAEQRLARYLAQERHAACRAANVTNARRSPAGDEAVDMEGIGAELAFCRLNNVYPFTDIVVSGAWPEVDATLPGGIPVEVKSTVYQTGQLLVPANARKETEAVAVYVLMTGKFPGPYRLAGCMDRRELIKPDRITNPGHGDAYTAKQTDLIDLAEWYAATDLALGAEA
jgi:hypothetical protein